MQGRRRRQEEIALLEVLAQRSAFAPRWGENADEEWLEVLRAISGDWSDDPQAWLLFGAFPRYDRGRYFREV